jgi:hypothetical protein
MQDAIKGIAQAISLSVYPWQKVLMAMIQTAFDVSCDHPIRRFLVMAGFLSMAEEWVEFDGRWRKRLAEDDLPYFHMQRFAHCGTHPQKPFNSTWIGQEARRMALMRDLLDIICDHVHYKFAVAVQLDALDALTPETRDAEFGSTPLAVAGSFIVGLVANWKKIENWQTRPEYFFEDGDVDKGTLMKVIKETTGTDPIFRPKVDNPAKGIVAFTPLQAADILAFEVKKVADEIGRVLPPDFRFRFPYEQLHKIRGESRLFSLAGVPVADMLAKVDRYFIDNPLGTNVQ